ncbi:MAG: asparagine synthase (glutamine-hydrolyzing) [Nitrospiraceae bacterium]
MCAIAGLYNCTGERVAPAIICRMTEVQSHRGPDGEGYVLLDPSGEVRPQLSRTLAPFDGIGTSDRYTIGFGHRRLAILDLSERGRQPMATEDGRYWVVYNGEIYNYRELRDELRGRGCEFRSESDTEVLLNAYKTWGPQCLERFNGMFAFALWDGVVHQLFCARDRFGEKPFYYLWDGKCFAFASEIKGLLPLLRRVEPNSQAIYAYLDSAALDYSENTFLAEIQQLLPAHYLTVQDNRLTRTRYWELPNPDSSLARKPEQLVESFEHLFRDSVRLRLRSDVPIGSCLSGGLDSSSIVCVASSLLSAHPASHLLDARQKAFSSCFEEAQYDERRYSRDVVEHAGIQAYYTFPDPKELAANLDKLVWNQEEPFGSTSVFAQWMVMRLAADHGMKVLLDGQGADELLAGYHGFFGPLFADLIQQGRWGVLREELRAYRRLHGTLPRYIYANLARALLPRNFVQATRTRLTGSARWIDREFQCQGRSRLETESSYPSHVQAMQERLIKYNGLRALLHCEDRNAMAFGIETRLPFLDHRLVEFLLPLPNECKLRDGWTKVILRESMRGILPESVRLRADKMGFVTPEASWFKTVLREMVRDMLHDQRTRTRGYVNVGAAKKEFEAHLAGRQDISSTIWRWLNLELWSRRFLDGAPCSTFSS